VADLDLQKLGRYELVRELGRGAMGVVYEGFDPVVGRRVAVKTARRDVIESSTRADELMARFLREARAAGALNHPNIVTVYDAGEENGVAYIAMEFLDGTDLQKLLDQNRRFPVDQVLEITSTICGALSHAHANGVIHRDIKPSNVVLLESGLIKVADFGIARISDSHLTQEGSVIGTPQYMSPEQFMGHAVDARSDLFSAGVIVYEMLTGEKPFHGNSLSAVMHSVLNVVPVPPRMLNFAVSDCLSRVVMKALSKDMRARYQSADEMCRALKECLKECPDPAVLLVDTPETALAQSATVVSNGSSETLVISPRESSTQVLEPAPRAAPAAPAPKALSSAEARRRLRARRTERGKTIEQLCLETRVPERYLVAFEEGSLKGVEGEEWQQVAAYLRAYCGALDLSPEPYLGLFETMHARSGKPAKRRTGRHVAGIAALLLLLAVVASLYAASRPAASGRKAPGVSVAASVEAPVVEFLKPEELPPRGDYYQMFVFPIRLLDAQDAGEIDVTVSEKLEDDTYRPVARGKIVNEGAVVLRKELAQPRLEFGKKGYKPSQQEPLPPDMAGRDVRHPGIELPPA
jgi:serine/threonine protein kinase